MQQELEQILAKHQEEIVKAVSETIIATVNGKINRLDEKMTKHVDFMEKYVNEDIDWKKMADPYIKLAVNIQGTWKFLVYVVGGILAFVGLYTVIHKQ